MRMPFMRFPVEYSYLHSRARREIILVYPGIEGTRAGRGIRKAEGARAKERLVAWPGGGTSMEGYSVGVLVRRVMMGCPEVLLFYCT